MFSSHSLLCSSLLAYSLSLSILLLLLSMKRLSGICAEEFVCVCVCVCVYNTLSPGTVTWTSFSPETRTPPLYSELKRHKQTSASLEFSFTECRVVVVCEICIWGLVVNSIVCGFVSFPSLMRPHGSAVIAVWSRPVTRVQNQPCLV